MSNTLARRSIASPDVSEHFVPSDNGVRIRVAVHPGPEDAVPLVILNNFFMTADHWPQFTTIINKARTIINYDLRHQGRSSRVDGEISLDDHVRDLEAIFETLGLGRVVLMGTCISTMICKQFAIAHPERIAALLFVGPIFDPFGGMRRHFMHKALLASLAAGGAQALFDHYYPLLYTSRTIQANRMIGYLVTKTAFLETNSVDQLSRHLNSTLSLKDDPADIAKLSAPALFLCGSDDFLTSIEALDVMVKQMPAAEYAIISASGHNPYVDSTDAFQDIVCRFLSARHIDAREPENAR